MVKSQISHLKVAINSLTLGNYGHLKIGFLSYLKYMFVPSLNETPESIFEVSHTSQNVWQWRDGGELVYPRLLSGDIMKYIQSELLSFLCSQIKNKPL